MRRDRHDQECQLCRGDTVDRPELSSQARRAVAFPFSGKSFIVEPSDLAKPRWPRDRRDVLPLLVPLKGLNWRRGALLVHAPMRPRRSGMLIGLHGAPSVPNRRSTLVCAGTSRTGYPARSSPLPGRRSLAPRWRGTGGAMGQGSTDDGRGRGVRNRSLTACRSSSPTILRCASATKRSTRRCTSKGAALFDASSPRACAPGERCACPGSARAVGASPSSRRRFSSASVRPRSKIARFPATGKGTSSWGGAALLLERWSSERRGSRCCCTCLACKGTAIKYGKRTGRRLRDTAPRPYATQSRKRWRRYQSSCGALSLGTKARR